MVQVTGQQFDADGNLTQLTQYVDANTARVTTYGYDWRDRRVTLATTDGTTGTAYLTQNTLDNLGRIIVVDRFYTPAAAPLRSWPGARTSYDSLGRAYQNLTYAVDPTTGTVGVALVDNTWYDAAGHVDQVAARRRENLYQDGLRRPGPAGQNNTSATTRPRPAIPTSASSSPTTRSSSRPRPLTIRPATSFSPPAAAACTTPPAPGRWPARRQPRLPRQLSLPRGSTASAARPPRPTTAPTAARPPLRPDTAPRLQRHRAGLFDPVRRHRRRRSPRPTPRAAWTRAVRRRRPRYANRPELRVERHRQRPKRNGANDLHPGWPDRHADGRQSDHRQSGDTIHLWHRTPVDRKRASLVTRPLEGGDLPGFRQHVHHVRRGTGFFTTTAFTTASNTPIIDRVSGSPRRTRTRRSTPSILTVWAGRSKIV